MAECMYVYYIIDVFRGCVIGVRSIISIAL